MRNDAVSDSIFNKSAMGKVFALVAFKCYVAEMKNIVCTQIFRIGDIRIRLEIHIGYGDYFILSIRQIILFTYSFI